MLQTPNKSWGNACLGKWKAMCLPIRYPISDIFYILRKDFSVEKRKDLLRLLCGGLHVVPEDKDMILEVLGRDEWRDLEDGLQMQCAKEAGADYVVTQNLKDFQKSEIEAVSEEHFCELLKNGGS